MRAARCSRSRSGSTCGSGRRASTAAPGTPHAETATRPELLADLEHVLRVPGHPVRLCAAEREREPHLPVARRVDRRAADPVARRAGHRPDRAADHRLPQRPHLGPPRAPPAVFPGRRAARDRRAGGHAAQPVPVDRGGHAVDPRRLDQHLDGAVPRAGRRHAARPAALARLLDAELVHRRGRGGRIHAALAARQRVRREQRRRARPVARLGQVRVLPRRRGVSRRGAVDGAVDPRVLAGRAVPSSPATPRRSARRAGGRAHSGAASSVGDRLAGGGPRVRRAGGGVRLGQAALCARLRPRRVRRAAVRGRQPPAARRHRRHAVPHRQRPVPDAARHAAARGGAVPLVVRAVRDVDLHDGGGHRRTTTARPTPPRSRTTRAPTGSACCSRPTTASPRWRRW